MLTWYYDTLRSPSYEISNALKMIDDFGFKTLSTKNYHIDESSIKIEMAGVNASEIDVSVDGKFLKISAKSKHGKEHSYSYKTSCMPLLSLTLASHPSKFLALFGSCFICLTSPGLSAIYLTLHLK